MEREIRPRLAEPAVSGGERSTVFPVEQRPLPGWPLAVGFVGYPLWWILGVGDLIWPVVAAVMIHFLWTCKGRSVRAPRGFGVWLLFLLWVMCSVIGVDSVGRLIGFFYRLLLYVSASVVFLYVYNARDALNPRYVAGVFTSFWAVVTVGGYLGLLFPLLAIRTPLAYILPGALQQNELIQEMVIRRVTQYNPDAWNPLYPRPSAPFLYTNGWGYAYAVLLPVVVAYLAMVRGGRRFWWVMLGIPISLVPAFLSLNRGMFVGFGVALLYVAVRAVLAGSVRTLGALIAICLAGGAAVLLVPLEERLDDRLETSSTTEDRADLYAETFDRALESPVLGYGAPRPSQHEWQPSVGTQGQAWMVLFSHGFGALALFLAWFAIASVQALRRDKGYDLAMGAGVLYTLVAVFFYSIVGTGLIMIMVACAVVMRPQLPTTENLPEV